MAFYRLPSVALALAIGVSTIVPAPIARAEEEKGAAGTEKAVDAVSHDGTIRIKAGSYEEFKDKAGNTWAADKGEESGFKGGETIARPDSLEIAGTEDPELYRTERYSMESFTKDLPNGKYVVKLHFAETYDGVTGEGQRVFTYKIGDEEVKDFDVFKKADGANKAIVETHEVDVKDGKLVITFTPQTQNPLINAIEITSAK